MPEKNYKITVLCYVLLTVSVGVIIYSFTKINTVLINQSVNYRTHLQYHTANDSFRHGTDILTEAVRHYVTSMNPVYMEEYFEEAEMNRHRERAIELVKPLKIDQRLKDCLSEAMKTSKQLMYAEYHAMHLITEEGSIEHPEVGNFPLSEDEQVLPMMERHSLAMELLWDDAYAAAKNEIYAYLAEGLEGAKNSAMRRHIALRKELLHRLGVGCLGMVVMLVTIFGLIYYRHYLHERLVEERARENLRMNRMLKDERDKAIKAEKAKSYFFSSVSHDIRTPLNAIIGFSEMLQLGIDDPAEKKKALDAIVTSGHTLLELINDVLDLSKLEAGKMELHPTPTDMANLISKVALSFEAATARTSLQLRTEVQKMPYLQLDPQRIRQILFNLIGNAVKFTPRGSVTVRGAYENGTFILSVSDTGCGISPENIKKLMSPYVQLKEHDSSQGTGLGLAICKQLASQMHGTLEIESTEGKGTTFTLRVPNVVAFTEKESEEYVNEHNHHEPVLEMDDSISQKNILIVDDQKLNQSILRTMLGRLGLHKVTVANNGQEALDMMNKAGNVDIVLTDMFMPVMDGDGLVREIRKTPKFASVPVFVITADVEMQNKFKDQGFDNILLKPITIEKLNNLLAGCQPHAPEAKA